MPGCAPLPETKKLILIVIDGLTPSVFEAAVGDGRAPALSFLAEHGRYARAVSTFPSLTPVCLSSLATGAHPDVHHIPHLVWYDRERARLVEYGSAFAAGPACRLARALPHPLFHKKPFRPSPPPRTAYEAPGKDRRPRP